MTSQCEQCNSLKRIPKEIFEQTSSPSPTTVGTQFAADIIQRKKQRILINRDTLSSYTTSCIIPDETGDSLRTAILINTLPIRMPTSTVRVDNASGFVTLRDDHLLKANGIMLDFGNVNDSHLSRSVRVNIAGRGHARVAVKTKVGDR